MKKILYTIFTFFSMTSIVFAGTVEVQRLSKFKINPKISKVFILSDLISNENDKIGFKDQIIKYLQQTLQESKRYAEVVVGEPKGYDPNKEVVAVIQGDIISGGEKVTGQFTEWAVCKGGIAGVVGAGVAGVSSEQGITMSHGRNFLCKLPNFITMATEMALELVEGPSPRDEVARIYKYKNYSLYLQTNLTITQLGTERKTLVIRTDSASFSRHYPDAKSYRNVRESSQGQSSILGLMGLTPVVPMPAELSIVEASNPGSNIGKYYDYVVPGVKDIPEEEVAQIRESMSAKVLKNFIRSIAPYKIPLEVGIDETGNPEAVKLMTEKKYDEAKVLIEGLPEKLPADLYNLALCLETSAITNKDFDDVLAYYTQAFDGKPDNLYALGIGRAEQQVRSNKQ